MTDIEKISSETQEAMRRKSAANLPDSPRDHGYTPQQIKAAFVRLILDNKESIVAEINRIVEESNAAIGEKLNASEISSWAKATVKPTYTAAEVGALPAGTKIPHKTSDIINDSGFITALVSNLANYYTKDSVYTKAEVDSAIPTDNASLLNGAGYVGKNVSDLANYYLKTETMTKSEINALIASLSKIEFRKVDSLPEVGEAGIIYIVPAENTADNDKYDEFFWQDGGWEYIGDTSVDVKSLVEDALRQAQQSGSFNGANGITPHIGSNGNWFIGDEDTGKPSRGEKGDPTEVTQTTGQSETAVMSQKATTAEINALKSDLANKLPKSPADWEAWTAEEQAMARKRIGEPQYELIEEITLEEEALFYRETEPNGEAYNFKKILINIITPPYGDSNTWGSITFNKTSSILLSRWTTYNANNYIGVVGEIINGRFFATGGSGSTNPSNLGTSDYNPSSYGMYTFSVLKNIRFEKTLPIGANIKIYGVRA